MEKGSFCLKDLSLTRRGFLKALATAGLFGGSLADGMSRIQLSLSEAGDKGIEAPKWVLKEVPIISLGRTYRTYDTDVLVIGGGSGGTAAAIEAFTQGADVICVDKGPWGWSGASGVNWDQCLPSTELKIKGDNADVYFRDMIVENRGLPNQEVTRAIADLPDEIKPFLWLENKGPMLWRTPDDKLWMLKMGTDTVPRWARGNTPWMIASEVRRRGIRISDRTMITDLLKHGGAVVGATGIDIETGEFTVFRAKSTVLSSGPYGQLSGWGSISGICSSQVEATGDGHAMAYRAGAELTNMEFCQGEIRPLYPESLAGAYGFISVYLGACYGICDKDHEFLFDPKQWTLGQLIDRPSIFKVIMEKVKEGKGGPHGGIFWDCSAVWDELDAYKKADVALTAEQMGFDLRKEVIEIIPTCMDFAFIPPSGISINEKGETTIPGLYANSGSFRETFSLGILAGRNAAKRAHKIGRPRIDWEQVTKECNKVYGLLERAPTNPITPYVVRHNIQKLCLEYLGVLRSGEGIKKCLAKLETIKREDLPRMYIPTKTRTWNRGWFEALETINMLTVLEMIARSALMRTESRMLHLREDYPKMDNVNWLANVYVKRDGGKMAVEKRPILWTEIPPGEIREMLGGLAV